MAESLSLDGSRFQSLIVCADKKCFYTVDNSESPIPRSVPLLLYGENLELVRRWLVRYKTDKLPSALIRSARSIFAESTVANSWCSDRVYGVVRYAEMHVAPVASLVP